MKFRELGRDWMAAVFVVLLFIVAGVKSPLFLQPTNLDSILRWMPLVTVVAMGEALVILTRGIDISVGSILGCTGIAVGTIYRSHPGMSPVTGMALGIAFGALLGFVNAAAIAWGKLPPLIVTIGTLGGYRGLAFVISKGAQIDASMIPDSLSGLTTRGIHVGHVTVNVLLLIALCVALITWLLLRFTRLGRNLFAYGGNPEAAYLRGISPTAMQLFVYTAAGALSGLAGVMYAARFGFVSPSSAGQGFELTVIAAVAIGGVKLTGGAGSVFGVLMGCLLLSSINVALSVLGIDENWQVLAYGAVIVIAITLDSGMRSLAARRAAA